MRASARGVAGLVLWLGGLAGCDDAGAPAGVADGSSATAIDAASGIDAAAGVDAAPAADGATQPGDAGAPDVAPGAVLSNTPGVLVVSVPRPGMKDHLRVTRMRLSYRGTNERDTYETWIAEIANVSADITYCSARITFAYKDAGGAMLARHFTNVDAPATISANGYRLSDACLAPGEKGGAYSTRMVPAPLDLSRMAGFEYSIDAAIHQRPAKHPHAPLVQPGEVFEWMPGFWGLKGTATGAGAPVHDVILEVYAEGDDGLPLNRLSTSRFGTLAPGETFTWKALLAYSRFTRYVVFTSFFEGAKPEPDGGARD